MAHDRWRPDMVIGVDFGMTCTGVAWSAAPEWTEPRTLMSWPGRASYEVRNKVDSAVAYAAGTEDLISWGFDCDEEDVAIEPERNFKLALDPGYFDPSGYAPGHEESLRFYHDYLGSLYQYITRHFRETIPRFGTKSIEFVFSVPTTWKDPSMIAIIERTIKNAGFGRQPNHKASISLTEAEAAAVYAAKQQMMKGDVFLVCDSGGGTTDLNVLKVSSASRGRTELEPLQVNEGRPIGSTLIDHQIEKVILERLKLVRTEIANDNLHAVARRMIQTRFMSYKCSFGSSAMKVAKLPLPIPDMAMGRNIPHAGVENSSLVLQFEDLQRIFDDQIDRTCSLIDEQLRAMQLSHAGESVAYLVLSGGLGSSPYVQKRVREHYERGAGTGLANSQNMVVLVASEPQLAVVHGLVMARVQAMKGGPEVLSTRRCPVSYGVLCRQPYDPLKHQGEDVEQDPLDKKRWAERQISWFIKQGQVINIEAGVNQRFRYKIPLGHEQEPWRTRIVMSTLPTMQLPRSMRFEGVKPVCTLETVLDGCDMKRRNQKWFHLRREYNEAEFDVKLLVGAGLKFEIWGQRGRKSRGHEEIEVEWEPVDPNTELPDTYDKYAMYPAGVA